MKKFSVLLTSLLLLSSTLFGASYKVVDKSSKKIPDWVGGSQKEYFICSTVSSVSLDDAKKELLEQVKLKMLESIAQNVDYKTLSSIRQTTGTNVDEFRDDFLSAIKINSANIPFLSAISESKISDFYWEINKDKKSDKISYHYSIKYPFPSAEIKELVAKFEQRDKEMSSRYKELSHNLHTISSFEQIEEGCNGCDNLVSYFFDSTRKKEAQNLKKLYKQLYNQITVITYSEKLGEATFGLLLNGNKLSSSLRPTIKYDKDDISSVVVAPHGGDYRLTYNADFCNEGLPYTFTIMLYIDGRRVEHNIHFTYSKKQASIEPTGKIVIVGDSIKQGVISGTAVEFELKTKGVVGNMVITSISIETPSAEGQIVVNTPFTIANPAALFTIKFRCDAPLQVAPTYHSSSTIKIARGEIKGYWGAMNTPFKVKIALPYSCNW